MNLSDLQTKEVVDVASGKRIGSIIDVIISSSGNISKIVLEETKGSRRFLNTSKDEVYLDWQQLIKIGDDIILIDSKKN
ncbi:MAG: YlmC/YmxH family sporulation protein [Bacilli bacterium]|nr:YlmC/YmxH family sporulation protein [Bacilli bacterium]